MRRRPSVNARARLGAALLVVVALVVALAFGASLPFGAEPFELRALVRSDAQVAPGSPVRIAGVQVGRVRDVRPADGDSPVTELVMEITGAGLPLRAGTTAKIRPRLFLEGNFFVDLHPGTHARELRSGATLPVSATAGPVQLDRVLSDLPAEQRADLQATLRGLGAAYGGPGPDGRSAASALHRALRDAPPALRGTALVTSALQGESPGDLSGAVSSTARVLGALAEREGRLADLVTSFDATLAAFSARRDDLRASVALLPRVTSAAQPALDRVRAALPPVRALAGELRPGLHALPALIDAGLPWIGQARRLVADDELGGLLRDLQPAIARTGAVVTAARPLLRSLDAVDRCLLRTLLPVGRATVDDPPLTTGLPLWTELLQGITALGGAGQNFDGNGAYLRGQTAGGDFPVKTSPLPTQGELFGNAIRQPLGTRPAYPGKEPPFRTDVSCAASTPPDLQAATGAGP